jgi:lysophospholipase L1-like esterase
MTSLSRRRKLLLALTAMVLVSGVTVGALIGLDIYVHWRTQDVAGVNIWGYRGAPVGAKRPGEVRVVMVGGSTAFGWGLPANESIPAFLERRLNAAGRGRRFTVINLGAPGQGAYGFVTDLADFASLQYDIVCLYEGYNDLDRTTIRGRTNYLQWRRESPVFRWTGYYPILPVVLREKADVMLGGHDADRVQFRGGAATRAAAGAMRGVAAVIGDLGGQVGGLSPVPPNAPVDPECIETWKRYCGSVRDAVVWALARDKRVIVITQPLVSDSHREQQANMAAMLKSRFGSDSRVIYVDAGDAVNMRDPQVAYDGIHLVAAGNDAVAARLVEPVLEAAQ